MTTRLPRLTDEHRAKIKTTQILQRLQAFALGGNDPVTKEPIRMSQTQVTAAIALLKKTLPDLAMVEHTGEVQRSYVIEGAPEVDRDAWLEQARPSLQ